MVIMMTSHQTETQFLAVWPMSYAKPVTEDNRKNPEHHHNVVVAIRRLSADRQICLVEKSWPNHTKHEQQIGSKQT